MITKTTKTVLFASLIVAMILPFSGMLMAEGAPNENANKKAKLTAQEKAAVPPSIKAYEVSNMAASDVKSKIDSNTLSIDHKGKQHKLVLIENDLFNNAVTNDNTENAIAYTGFVAGDPNDSKVSLVVSDNEFAGFVYTPETIIVIEPLSFYGPEFAGDKQIVYDITDLDFEFTISDDVHETANNNASTVQETSTDSTSWLVPIASADPGHVVDLIIDTDDDYYNINTTNCVTRLLTVFGGVDTIYNRDTEVDLSLVEYNCNQSYLSATDTSGYLSDLIDEWENDSTDRGAVIALIGHDMTGGGIGEAEELGVIGDNSQSYAVAQTVEDTNSINTYDGTSYEQKILVAHELGHLMNATHNNDKILGDYTIMAGGVSIDEDNFTAEFIQESIDTINDYADAEGL